MRQETGSKVPQAANKVSIQLALDGHSFSVHGLDGQFPDDITVEVEVLTVRTMLVPKEVFASELACELLAANGMAAAGDQRAVYSDPQQEIVAVMAAPREAVRQVAGKLGERVRYTTPLLHTVEGNAPTVWMLLRGGLLYIKVWDGALRLAGVVPAPDEADVVYFTERLGTEFPLGEYVLRFAGDAGGTYAKLLKGYFKETTCE